MTRGRTRVCRGHRAKTHLDYRITTFETGEALWRTPHGLHRIVDAAGTHDIDASTARAWTSPDPLDRAIVRLHHQLHTGQLTRAKSR